MTDLEFAEEVQAQLRERNPRFHQKAYIFILCALHTVIDQLEGPRHISGGELATGVRELALSKFGPMARTVLEHWGIHRTEDLGEMVFALVECGILTKQEEDTSDDFVDVFDFEEAFDRNYPWEVGR